MDEQKLTASGWQARHPLTSTMSGVQMILTNPRGDICDILNIDDICQHKILCTFIIEQLGGFSELTPSQLALYTCRFSTMLQGFKDATDDDAYYTFLTGCLDSLQRAVAVGCKGRLVC